MNINKAYKPAPTYTPRTYLDAQTVSDALDGKPHGKKGHRCNCPVRTHSSGKTLDVSNGDNGKLLVNCKAGCSQQEVIDALRSQGLWPDSTPEQQAAWKQKKQQERLEGAELRKEIADEMETRGEPLTEADQATKAEAEATIKTCSFSAVVDELAALSPLDYDTVRENKAKELGVRVATLDKEVAGKRGDLADEVAEEVVEEITPHEDPVDGSELLGDMVRTLSNHVALPQGSATALAVWSLGTYCMEAMRLWPKLLFNSPEKRCGKSTAMEALEGLSYRALLTSNITASALFHCIEEWKPTLLIDEADTFAKDNDELNGIINAGHTRRTAAVIRSEKVGDSFKPKKFSVWCPQVLAGIGNQRDTLHDRAVVVSMRRKLPTDTVQKLPVDYYERTQSVRRKCLRWAKDNQAALKTSQPEVPPCGNDRAQDNWQPLFAIAAQAGGMWPDRIKRAYLLATANEGDEQTASTLLLGDIKTLFSNNGKDSIFSEDLVDALVAIEDRPWFEWKRGKPITQNSLARLLKPFNIKPKTVRVGELTKKGYSLAAFKDAFGRYIPPPSLVPPVQTVTPSQPSDSKGFSDFQTVTGNRDVPVAKPPKASEGAGCDGVTVQTGGLGKEAAKTTPELQKIAIAACDGLNITPDYLLDEAAPEDMDEFLANPELARAFAESLAEHAGAV